MRHEQRPLWIGLGTLIASVLLGVPPVVLASPLRNSEGPQLSPSTDAVVFVGAGRLGGWETRFTASNASALELFVRVGVTLDFPGGCPETGCPGYEFMDLAPNGSATRVNSRGWDPGSHLLSRCRG